MVGLMLASYRSAVGVGRVVTLVVPGASTAAAGRPAPLAAHGGLVIDRDRAGRDPRVVAELTCGEGLAVARATVAEYLPRARRARGVIARRLEPADLHPPTVNGGRAA